MKNFVKAILVSLMIIAAPIYASMPIMDFAAQPASQNMVSNSTQNLVFTVRNNVPTSPVPLGNIYLTPATNIAYTVTNNCNSLVPANGTCDITVSFNSTNITGSFNLRLIVEHGERSHFLLSSPITFLVAESRTVTFVNKCPFTVWFGVSGGSTESKLNIPATPTVCNTDSDCYTGSSCITTGAIKQCFWDNIAPSDNNYELATNGINSISIPVYDNGIAKTWGGGFAGRTGCTSTSCDTADCGGGTGACTASVGFNQPSTAAEFTFQGGTNSDFYDITVIDGINIPISITPDVPIDSSNPFTCGAPGSTVNNGTAPNVIGACSWSFTPPSVDYKVVPAGGANCAADATCNAITPGDVCGLSNANIVAGSTQTTCGKFLGYWTGNEICGLNNNYTGSFNCATGAPAPNDASTTYTNLFLCTGVTAGTSCYTTGAPNSCCGCVNWQNVGGILMPSDSTIVPQCNPPSNTTWTSVVLPTLRWIKQACPSAYVYPFDDKSSTFTCTKQNSSNENIASYTITFCPAGITGAP